MLHAVRAMPSRASAALACLVLVASAAVSVVLGRGLSTWQQAVGGSAQHVVAGLRSAATGSSITVPTAPAQPPAPTTATGHAQHVTPTVSATHTLRGAPGTARAAVHHGSTSAAAHQQEHHSSGRHDGGRSGGNLVKGVQKTAARSTGLRGVGVGKATGDLTHGLASTTTTLTKGALGLLGARGTAAGHPASAGPGLHPDAGRAPGRGNAYGHRGGRGHAYAYGHGRGHAYAYGHGRGHGHAYGHANSHGRGSANHR